MYATDTLTGQQQAAATLVQILAVPGLSSATWSVYPDRLASGGAEISGQLDSAAPTEVRASIDAYVAAFSWLTYDDERVCSAVYDCPAFIQVGASGVRDGVLVKVWGAAAC